MKNQYHGSAVWSVCHNTEKNLWKSMIVNCDTKEIECSSKITTSLDEAHKSLLKVMQSA